MISSKSLILVTGLLRCVSWVSVSLMCHLVFFFETCDFDFLVFLSCNFCRLVIFLKRKFLLDCDSLISFIFLSINCYMCLLFTKARSVALCIPFWHLVITPVHSIVQCRIV